MRSLPLPRLWSSTTHRRKMLIVDGQRLDFSTGTLEVTDVEVVRKLRDLQRQRPTFGVKEIA